MPIYEFICENDHITEKILPHRKSSQKVFCNTCYVKDGRYTKTKKLISRTSKPVIKGFNSDNNYGLK